MRKTIYISCLLKDNMIIAYHIGSNARKYPHDYYKDFYYADKGMENCDEIYEVKYMTVEYEDDEISTEFNFYIFDELAQQFYKHWEIHPNHFGESAY